MLRVLLWTGLVFGAASCGKPLQTHPDIKGILDAQIESLVAAEPTIRCGRRSTGLASYDCSQTLTPRDDRHFAMLSISVTSASGTVPKEPSRLVNLFFGPGGGGGTVKGRTRDGRYDVVGNEMQSLTVRQESRLPSSTKISKKIIESYDDQLLAAE